MRVLIVGGTGLISSAITQQLARRGDDVTVCTRAQREGPLPPGVSAIVADRTAHAAFEAAVARAGRFDAVVDMVCYEPADAESAVRAFRGMTGQYVLSSTVDVYTKPARRYPITEDAERRPSETFPYAAKKARCEQILLAAHAHGDLGVTIIRPAQTYGEGATLVHTMGFGAEFLKRIRQGRSIIVHGDGSSLWVACHRDDVARAFVGAVGQPVALGRAYNAAGEEWMTWNAYCQTVARALGAPPPRLVHIPTDLLARAAPTSATWCAENFSYDNVFDTSAARRDLGFAYTIGFEEGVRRTVAWLDERGRIDGAVEGRLYDAIIAAWERLGTAFVSELAGLDA